MVLEPQTAKNTKKGAGAGCSVALITIVHYSLLYCKVERDVQKLFTCKSKQKRKIYKKNQLKTILTNQPYRIQSVVDRWRRGPILTFFSPLLSQSLLISLSFLLCILIKVFVCPLLFIRPPLAPLCLLKNTRGIFHGNRHGGSQPCSSVCTLLPLVGVCQE